MAEKSACNSFDQAIDEVSCHHAVEQEIKPDVGTGIQRDPGGTKEEKHDRRFRIQIQDWDTCMISCEQCEEKQ